MPTMVDQLAVSAALIPGGVGTEAPFTADAAKRDAADKRPMHPRRVRKERVTDFDDDFDGRSESSGATHESTEADLQGAELLASMFTVSRHNSTSSNDESHSVSASPSAPPAKRGSRAKSGSQTVNKRVKRLEENRLAARRCREKKKEYVKTLEERLRRMESWNRTSSATCKWCRRSCRKRTSRAR
eukprot:Opistho-1_new@27077